MSTTEDQPQHGVVQWLLARRALMVTVFVGKNGRKRRRYRRLAARWLPDWAPGPIVDQFCIGLQDLSLARYQEHHPPPGNECRLGVDWYEEALACTARLCTCYGDSMRDIWDTIAGAPVAADGVGTLGSDERVTVVLCVLEHVMDAFQKASKRPPAATRKSRRRIDSLIVKLLDEINSDPEARAIFHDALPHHIGRLNLAEREKNGETIFPYERDGPFDYLSIGNGEVDALFTFPTPRWSSWSGDDKFWWMCEAIRYHCSMVDLLESARAKVAELINVKPVIAQPGRKDNGRWPFLVRGLSESMRELFGQPLDNVVAMLASAVENRPVPLSREDIRPYLAPPGKISRKKSQNPPGKILRKKSQNLPG